MAADVALDRWRLIWVTFIITTTDRQTRTQSSVNVCVSSLTAEILASCFSQLRFEFFGPRACAKTMVGSPVHIEYFPQWWQGVFVESLRGVFEKWHLLWIYSLMCGKLWLSEFSGSLWGVRHSSSVTFSVTHHPTLLWELRRQFCTAALNCTC